jgi:hypothetical protein
MILAETGLFNVSGKSPGIPLVTRCCKINIRINMKCEVVAVVSERISHIVVTMVIIRLRVHGHHLSEHRNKLGILCSIQSLLIEQKLIY